MLNIQTYNVRYPGAISAFNYTETRTLSLGISGIYQQTPNANDNFDIYATGTRYFYFGSGNWMASGRSFVPMPRLYDSFSLYETGLITGRALTGNLFTYEMIEAYGRITGNLITTGT